MKKALFIIVILLLLLLTACGREAPAASPAPTEALYPYAPPKLTLISGEEKSEAVLDAADWTCRTEEGEEIPYAHTGISRTHFFYETDWYSLGTTVLYARGEARLSFDGPEPDSVKLFAFTALGMLPLECRDGRFTPLAGANAYALTGTWDRGKTGGGGGCRYILLIEGAETNEPDTTEPEELRLTVTRADGYGCAFTLENLGSRPFVPAPMSENGDLFALLRRTSAGGWEWVQPIRRPMASMTSFAAGLDKGESRSCAWDWSYACGILPAGEYRLLLRGTLGRGAAKELVYLRGDFTLTDAEPESSGPSTLCPCPRWLEVSLYSRELNGSGHRWMQTLTPEKEGWATEQDFSLFRLTKEGELEFIPPEYNFPEYLNRTTILRPGKTASFEVELAARSGGWKTGGISVGVLQRSIC